MRKTKKLKLSMMLALIVLFTSAFPISIYAKQSEIITDNLSFEIGIGKDNCEKIKITNFQTGEIEYLKTSYNDNGTRTFSYEGRKITEIYSVSNYTGYLGSNAKYWKGSLEN